MPIVGGPPLEFDADSESLDLGVLCAMADLGVRFVVHPPATEALDACLRRYMEQERDQSIPGLDGWAGAPSNLDTGALDDAKVSFLRGDVTAQEYGERVAKIHGRGHA